jgi:hypothetical protein
MKTSRQRVPQSTAATPTDLPVTGSGANAGSVSAEQRHALIERAAYLLAEGRGFSPGEELDDWLAAETEIDRQLCQAEADVQ